MLSCQRIRLSERRDQQRPSTTSDGGRRMCSARNHQNKNIQIHKPISVPPKTPLYITTLKLPADFMPQPKKFSRPAQSARCIRKRGDQAGGTPSPSESHHKATGDLDSDGDLLVVAGTELPERNKRELKRESEPIRARFEPRLACCLRRNNSIPARAPSNVCSRAQRALSRDRGNAERCCRLSGAPGASGTSAGGEAQPDGGAAGGRPINLARTPSPNTLKVIRVDLIDLRPHAADCCDDSDNCYEYEYSDEEDA